MKMCNSIQSVAVCLTLATGFGFTSTVHAGESFAGCGTMFQGLEGCLLFTADQVFQTLLLEDSTGLEAGDRVYVSGTIERCASICGVDCLVDSEVLDCFEGCGQIVPGPQGCPALSTTTGEFFALESVPDGGGLSDQVFVTAGVLEDSLLCFPASVDALIDPLFTDCFVGCGTLVQAPFLCGLRFQADSGGLFTLENYGDFKEGDRIFVVGQQPPFCIAVPECPAGCIINNTVEECFDECGTIVELPFCGPVFQSSETGKAYIISDGLGEFGVGDSVRVTGQVAPCIMIPECSASGCINFSTIEQCPDDLFAGCGTLVQDGFCTLLQTDDGQLLLPDDLGGFSVGDRVFMTGTIDPECISICFAVCLSNAQVYECFESCGGLTFGPQGCLVFQTPGGFGYFIDSIGLLPFGQTFKVTGGLIDDYLCSPAIEGFGIVSPVVSDCDSADLDGDGVVGPPDLAILLGDWGPCGPFIFPPIATTPCFADFDGDGIVGPRDLAFLLGDWGR